MIIKGFLMGKDQVYHIKALEPTLGGGGGVFMRFVKKMKCMRTNGMLARKRAHVFMPSF